MRLLNNYWTFFDEHDKKQSHTIYYSNNKLKFKGFYKDNVEQGMWFEWGKYKYYL